MTAAAAQEHTEAWRSLHLHASVSFVDEEDDAGLAELRTTTRVEMLRETRTRKNVDRVHGAGRIFARYVYFLLW